MTTERWGGAKSLVFSVPFTDIKILSVIDGDGMRGAIYDPRKLSRPIPWLGKCPHCRDGEQEGLPLKIRKLIQVLCTAKPEGPDGYGLTLPNKYKVGARRDSRGWGVRVRKPRSRSSLHMVKLDGAEPTGIQESARDFRSPVLLRTLKMLFSAREATEDEVQAILLPMRKQPLSELPIEQRTPCRQAMHP